MRHRGALEIFFENVMAFISRAADKFPVIRLRSRIAEILL
jgi:hypothetical protein